MSVKNRKLEVTHSSTPFMANLTKRELVVRISNETGMVQENVLNIIGRLLCYITESLARGQTVEFRGFGVFEVRTRKARIGRNPNVPQHDVTIPAATVVKFKAGKEMKAQVLKLSSALAEQSGKSRQ
jgi:nucleoid DNA-binding protein